jgi:3-hydroxyacyl-[acyl-carrier-protein] dehydratase
MSRIKREINTSAIGGLLRPEPGEATGRYRFSGDFIGFSGHFPGDPVLPAIAQILAALDLAERMKGRPLVLTGVRNAKFHLRIGPGDEVRVECRECGDWEGTAFDARILLDEGLAASFRLSCAPVTEGG